MAGGKDIPKPLVIIGIFSGFGIILVIGLLTGLVARPNNCKPVTLSQQSTSIGTNNPTDPTFTFGTNPSTTPRTSTSTTSTTTAPTSVTRTVPTVPTSSQLVTSTASSGSNDILLPDIYEPINYNLLIKSYFNPIALQTNDNANDRFNGEVTIHFRLKSATNQIRFHADQTLKIDNRSIVITNVNTNQEITITDEVQAYTYNQFYAINLKQTLQPAEYRMKINFNGDYGLPTNLVGFYKTKYTEFGATKNIVATKFQPIDARKAFPCFDEPALKATFEITLEHPTGSKAISNWPQKSVETIVEATQRVRTVFEKTAKMSTYLAAWAIVPEDFGFRETMSANGKPIRVYARKSAVDTGMVDFALDVSKKSLDFFENEYFMNSNGVPPKVDLIAFPDFSSSAMEHWGIIGYRESSLLFSDSYDLSSAKQSVAFTIAHEISHFWFGNLVTCKWWDDLWLNEAMARTLQFKAIQKLYPDWDVDNQFISNYLVPVMYDDGYEATHPVSATINSPSDISSVFDSITYDKGSSILRMLESTVGDINFRDGLRAYLNANEFGASVAAQFYNTLQLPSIMSAVSPREYMENWLLQKNYPGIDIILTRTGSTSSVKFVQSRFLLRPLDEENGPTSIEPSPFDYKWMIYLQCKAGGTYNGNGSPVQHVQGTIRDFEVFMDRQTEITFNLDRQYTWVKCNKDFRGYYVSDYSTDVFEALTTVLTREPTTFSIGDRANLIHVAYSFAFLGVRSYSVPAMLTSYLDSWENEYVPWRVFTWHMGKIAGVFEHRPAFKDLKAFSELLVNSLATRINLWDDQGTHSRRLLKNNMIDFECRMQSEACLINATTLFGSISPSYFLAPDDVPNNLAPNLRGPTYKYHIQNTNNYLDYNKLGNLYVLTNDPQERALAFAGTSLTRLAWIIDAKFYEMLSPNSRIRPQDFFTLVTLLGRNTSARRLAWYFVRHYWFQIVYKFGLSSRAFASSIKSICETFDNEYFLQEMFTFFEETPPGVGELQRKQAIEIVRNNIIWVVDREEDIRGNLFGYARRNQF